MKNTPWSSTWMTNSPLANAWLSFKCEWIDLNDSYSFFHFDMLTATMSSCYVREIDQIVYVQRSCPITPIASLRWSLNAPWRLVIEKQSAPYHWRRIPVFVSASTFRKRTPDLLGWRSAQTIRLLLFYLISLDLEEKGLVIINFRQRFDERTTNYFLG